MNTETFLADPLLVAARDAALIATSRMTHWRQRLDTALVEAKGDPNDLVTVADAEIESLVAGYLRAARPQDTMVGEEGAAARTLAEVPDGDRITARLLAGPDGSEPAPGADPASTAGSAPADPGSDLGPRDSDLAPGGAAAAEHASGADRLIEWHVDPIDGTVNYVRGIEQHCFSVGGRDPETGRWVIGLVAAPALRTVWFARAGGGAWKTVGLPGPAEASASTADPDAPANPATASGPATPATANPLLVPGELEYTRLSGTPRGRRGRVLATGFSYSPERRTLQLAALGRIMEEFDDIRRAGSAAVDLCYAAEGRVNAYCEYGINVYDWAAGAIIAEEAGLTVLRPAGESKLCIAADTPERFAFLREHFYA
ncbi:inositol monophosphatase family protein [Brevibacterium sp. CS2]|uniref:inositol monophosphatase family protein n=1 Tax=Brevibacterium sp. CS2 TaxID=2575923 RepID=UPI002670E8E6|nr:inositol monophosphatase family protein [Brevibacterium sp. CS2]